jgi:hypothetical protein
MEVSTSTGNESLEPLKTGLKELLMEIYVLTPKTKLKLSTDFHMISSSPQ